MPRASRLRVKNRARPDAAALAASYGARLRRTPYVTRPLWMLAGVLCFALGWVGLIVPMMPGFVFLLAATFCFARGNPAWERRMLEHPRFGPPLRDWRERRAISRPAKRSALVALGLAGLLGWLLVGFPLALFSIAALLAVGAWIWTRAE